MNAFSARSNLVDEVGLGCEAGVSGGIYAFVIGCHCEKVEVVFRVVK